MKSARIGPYTVFLSLGRLVLTDGRTILTINIATGDINEVTL